MNYLITGASSSIGKHLVEKYSKNSKNLIYALYFKNKPNIKKKNIKLIKFNLSKFTKLNKNKIHVFIHCASLLPSDKKTRDEFIRSNYTGSKMLLNQLDKKYLKKIIFLSSMSVYKKNKKLINEKSELFKNDYYSESKIKFENYLNKLSLKSGDLKILILRLPGYVGKYSKHNFISNTKKKIINNEEVQFTNPNSYFNNIIHEDTLIKYINRFIKIENKKITIINPASIYPMKLKNIIKLMFKLKNKKYNFKIAKSKSKSFIIDTKLARKLGYIGNSTRNEILKFMG